MTEKVDKITRVDIKEAFRHEDRNLTPWLCDNIDVIGEAIGVQLSNAEKEQTTGSFYVDIKALDESGNQVVIENQYGRSDHDHLGKIITYVTSFDAKTAIWVVEEPRQEHINAISWLNEKDNGCGFYLLKIEAIKIGDSKLAPLFTQIVGPSEESKQIGKIKKEDSERDKLRYAFWEHLLNTAKSQKLSQFSSSSLTKDAFVASTAGYNGIQYVFWVNQNSVRIELRIDRGKGSEEENLKILDKLRGYKEEIEKNYGGELNWADLEGYRVCSVRCDFDKGGYKSDQKEWDAINQYVVERMTALIKAIHPVLKKLKL